MQCICLCDEKKKQTHMYNLTKCVKNYYLFNPKKVFFLGPLYRFQNALCELIKTAPH